MKIMEFTEEEEAGLRSVFDDLDTDQSGALDSNELIEAARLYGLNPTRQEVEDAFIAIDLDNNGTLSFDEFKILMLQMRKSTEQQEAELEEAVDTMMKSCGLEDSENMSKDHFKDFLKTRGQDPLTDEEIDELFQDLDQDGDAETLNRRELITLFLRQQEAMA